MNQKEANIIAKLIKIAENQQKIIQKLAQEVDPMVAYLGRAAATAIANAMTSGSPTVNADGSGNYTVIMANTPEDNEIRTKVKDQFYRMIETQKPELTGKVNLQF